VGSFTGSVGVMDREEMFATVILAYIQLEILKQQGLIDNCREEVWMVKE